MWLVEKKVGSHTDGRAMYVDVGLIADKNEAIKLAEENRPSRMCFVEMEKGIFRA